MAGVVAEDETYTDAVCACLGLSAAPQLDKKQWRSAEGEVLPARYGRVLDAAQQFDAATSELTLYTSAEFVQRRDADTDIALLMRDLASLAVTLEHLAVRLAQAVEVQQAAREKLTTLHDRKSPDAMQSDQRLTSQLNLLKEAVAKQEQRFEALAAQVLKALSARQREAREAKDRFEDRQRIAEVNEDLAQLRAIADEAAAIIRDHRMR